jgi:hypothetical protein
VDFVPSNGESRVFRLRGIILVIVQPFGYIDGVQAALATVEAVRAGRRRGSTPAFVSGG